MIIAIDGPAGSGKSTVSREVAKRLGILYVDTGAMYRALTVKAVNKKADFKDEKGLIEMAKQTRIELVSGKGGKLMVLLDGRDVSDEIRTPELTKKVKFVAGVAGVREVMVGLQRSIAKSGSGAVLEGRDIGTVVLPDADKKFYLDADFEERSRRRHKELIANGQKADIEDIRDDVMLRDKSDMERLVAPLKKAQDAIVIDTTRMMIEEVVEKILSYLG